MKIKRKCKEDLPEQPLVLQGDLEAGTVYRLKDFHGIRMVVATRESWIADASLSLNLENGYILSVKGCAVVEEVFPNAMLLLEGWCDQK
jgi:hypothetical protein